MKVISAEDFGDSLFLNGTNRKTPVWGGIDLTFSCNMNCCHCYIPKSKEFIDRENELSFSEICCLIDELVDEGCLFFTISGGEPLIRDDFIDIYLYAIKKGLIITILTNGTLITPELAKVFSKYPNTYIEISLYGITTETYENITKTPNSFEKCLQGIEALLDNNVKLNLKTPILTLNAGEIIAINNFAKEKKLNFRCDPYVIPQLDGTKEPCKYRISPQDAVEFDFLFEDRSNVIKERLLTKENSRQFFRKCTDSVCKFSITPHGKLQKCTRMTTPSFNLHNSSFKEGWNSLYSMSLELFSNYPPEKYECSTCNKISICSPCPIDGIVENGAIGSQVEYKCKLTDLRIKQFS
ncbi:radical SAM/SPASM domain-containing protein [uncultured Draconibacterium sp.]|uniref:radical SAM/SPASM domain-containing protein n=1 Tax=uncultured Draconibacterium sp. TaxID=1573823 RepID=UPI0032169E9D